MTQKCSIQAISGVTNIILNYVNGLVIVTILMLLNWSETLSNKNSKSQRELEKNAVDEALNGLSLNVLQVCIKKTHKLYQQFVSSY